MVNVVAAVPKYTVKGPTPLNPVPVISTLLPPDAGPEAGESDVIVGMGLPSGGDVS
jgi:hypothetical protein